MFFVRSTFVSVVTQFSTSERKPWPLLLFLVFLLDVSLVIVELVLDIGLLSYWKGRKVLRRKLWGLCGVSSRVILSFFLFVYFPFLAKFNGILWLWHFNASFLLSLLNTALCSCILKRTIFNSIPLSTQVNLS